MYDFAIIGGGPAGLTAAIYARRAGKTVAVFEKSIYGGRISSAQSVENYPGILSISGFELASSITEQARVLGCELIDEEVKEITPQFPIIIATNKQSYNASKLIIATGTSPRKTGAENEEKFIGGGVSYCALCDGAFFKGKDVAVIGGGNTALADAIYLSTICNKVYLVHRREEFRAENYLCEKLKRLGNVEFCLNKTLSKFEGNTAVEKVILEDVKTKDLTEINLSGVFVAVGSIPNTEIFKNIVKLDEYGYIITDEHCRTNIDNIFAAGDCRAKSVRQLTTAVSDGTIAVSEGMTY